jgi:hypothetical protein
MMRMIRMDSTSKTRRRRREEDTENSLIGLPTPVLTGSGSKGISQPRRAEHPRNKLLLVSWMTGMNNVILRYRCTLR